MKLIWLALLVGTVCVGQTGSTGITSPGRVQVGEAPAPLKCGKWEHIEQQKSCKPHLPYDICTTYPPKCAPNLHVVTEKEWQELMARLKKLEQPVLVCPDGQPVGCSVNEMRPK